MYVPKDFAEQRVDVLHATIRQIGLGTLVTQGEGAMTASHVPMLVDAAPSPFGTLIGHLARANPQWRSVRPEMGALAIFLGAEAYISPAWYVTKQRTGKVVPTWNYVAVHAAGSLRFFDDAERLRRIVTRLTDMHEGGRNAPWQVSDAPADFIDSMLKAIIGFELTIARLEGKWKMSQNRPAEDRAGVVDGLTREGRSGEVAKIVAARAAPDAG